MLNDYGFIAGFKGADDDDVDVYLGPDEESLWVTVIHQLKRSEALLWNEYDEDKVMLGFESADAAKAAYLAHYDDERYFGSMSVFRLPDFREKLHRVQGEAITCRMDSGGAKKIKQLIERGKSVLKKSAITEKVGQVGKKFGERTSSFQKSQLNKQHQAQFGIDVKLVDKKLKKRLAEFAAENARLISKMQTNAHNQIEKIVVKAMVEGDLWEDVADKIEERFEVSESHAKLIARDQIGKLYGQVNADRQQELGVKKFIWRSLKDERVRDEHDEREKESDPAQGGTPYSYDDPPDDELPGEPIQCRCYAEPVFSSIGDSEDD